VYENDILWPEHELRKGESLDALIRNELVTTLNHILLEDSFVPYSMLLERRIVSEISRYYFRRGAFEDTEKIAAIIVTFSAVGRAGLLTVKQSGIPSMKCPFLMIIMTLHYVSTS